MFLRKDFAVTEKGEPMSDKDKDRIECAIRHIDSCLDVDPWARDIAIDAMQRLLDQASYRQVTGKLDDIYDALGRVYNMTDVPYEAKSIIGDVMLGLPSAQPEPSEITDEQAILHLQSTGWMQNHDREMYESGLREQLADDSGSYDSLIPCEDTISRQAAIDATKRIPDLTVYASWSFIDMLTNLPSVQPEQRWIPCAERLPERGVSVLISHVGYVSEDYLDIDDGALFFWNSGIDLDEERQNIAWMPLPEPWKGR